VSLYRKILAEIGLVAVSLGVGLAVGALIARLMGAPALDVIAAMLTSWRYLPDMVVEYAAILTLTGLAFALPLYTGLFNIGAEGAVYAGALAGLYVAVETGSLVMALLAGALVGTLLVGLAGLLRVRLGVNEVLSTIMINWIVYWVFLYIVITRLTDPMYPQKTVSVPATARIPWLPISYGVPGTIIVSAIVALGMFVLVRMTRYGLLIRATGANPEAARLRGVPREKYMIASMALAGALAGLAGSLHVTGFSYSLDVLGGAVRNYGFNGIGVALIGRNDPLGILLASFLFALLLAGSQVVEALYHVPKEAADLMVGVIVILLAAPEAFRLAKRLVERVV